MARYELGSRILAASWVALALACGGSEARGRGAASADSTSSGAASAASSASTSTGPTGDPICGEHWKWDGTRCVAIDASAKSVAGNFEDGGVTGAPSDPGGATTTSSEHASSRGIGTATGTRSPEEATTAQMVMEDERVGTGTEAKPGDTVRVHYVGTLLADGTQFDSSRKRGQPLEFRIGTGMVIKGFDRGVVGMKVGGLRKLTIPPELAYGRRGVPPLIPPHATLVFEIELMDVI